MTNIPQNNPNFVLPKVFLIGATTLYLDQLLAYLIYTGQEEFYEEINQAKTEGISDGEIMCSFYAKLCYASLTTKKNKNITKVRAIADNIFSTIESQHGSVFEHCSLNFVVTDCSRVYTHEQVRHRQGTAYSQTSGRYVRNDVLKLVIDPILEPVYNKINEVREYLQDSYKVMEEQLGLNTMTNFEEKKLMTSALRRILPNGQANELGLTENLRTLRFVIQQRTARFAEWEIRVIYNQVYELIKDRYPTMFLDAKVELVRGLNEITFKNHKI